MRVGRTAYVCNDAKYRRYARKANRFTASFRLMYNPDIRSKDVSHLGNAVKLVTTIVSGSRIAFRRVI